VQLWHVTERDGVASAEMVMAIVCRGVVKCGFASPQMGVCHTPLTHTRVNKVATGSANAMMLLSSAHAEVTALPKVDTNCTAPSLIPTVNGNTVRSFSTHGQLPAAQGSSTTVSRSDIRFIQHLDSSAHGLVRRWLNWLFFYPLITPLTHDSTPLAPR
jgi:hypothetical protein